MSDPELPANVGRHLLQVPRLEVIDGYWERAGAFRAKVLHARPRARLADTLIAQSCLDHDVTLVTRARDFRHFASVGGLRLLIG